MKPAIHTHTFQDGRCTFCGHPEGEYDKPHRDCDASCMHHCTEGGQHAPSCDLRNSPPDYIEIEWRIRCDGWWRKTLIGVVLFIIACGGVTNLVKILS